MHFFILALLLPATPALASGQPLLTPERVDQLHDERCVSPLIEPDFKHQPVVKNEATADGDLFDKVLTLADDSEETLLASDESHLEEAMDELGIRGDVARRTFVGGVRLSPLVNTGIVHQAIAQELVAGGFIKTNHARSLINNFKLLSKGEKRALVQSIVEGIVYSLDDRVNLENIKTLSDRARQFKMSDEEFELFLKHWRKLSKTGYQEAQLAILHLMQSPTKDFVSRILAAHHDLTGFRWFFWKRTKPRPTLKPDSGGRFHDYWALERYLVRTHPSMQAYFLTRHLSALRYDQLSALMNLAFWTGLPSELQAAAKARIAENALFDAKEELANNLRMQLNSLNYEISRLEKNTSDAISEKKIDVSVVIAQINATNRYTNHAAIVEGIGIALHDTVQLLDNRDFVEVTQAIMKQASRFNDDGWLGEVLKIAMPKQTEKLNESDFVSVVKLVFNQLIRITDHAKIYEVFQTIVERSKGRPLSQASESIIKKLIADDVASRFNNTYYANASLQLIAKPWERATVRPQMNLEKLKEEQAVTENSLIAALAELEALKSKLRVSEK